MFRKAEERAIGCCIPAFHACRALAICGELEQLRYITMTCKRRQSGLF